MNLDKEFPPARDGNVRWDGHRLIDRWMDGLIDGSISPELSLVLSNCTENKLLYGSGRMRKCIIIIPQGSRMPMVIIM